MAGRSPDPYSEAHYQAVSSTTSVWKHTVEETGESRPPYPELEGEMDTDIVIVGAGITGITLAYRLLKAGRQVCVVDAHRVGHGVSGFNSGHLVTMLLDTEYKSIIKHFGEPATRTVARALGEAIDFIERLSMDERIDCDFKRVNGYLFAEQESQVNDLLQEADAAERAGIVLNRVHRAPLPFPTANAAQIVNQARFHPLKYVRGLARRVRELGGTIYEESRVTRLSHNGDAWLLETPRGWVNTQEVVLATHTPIGFRPAVQTRLTPLRSYIIGVRVRDEFEDALYWDMDDPYHYIRQTHDEQGPLVIVGGEDHKPGIGNERDRFRNLEEYARSHFEVLSVDYCWSAQLYDPADGLPYIGKLSGTYIATGYTGEGLTFGTLAARIIADQILGIRNECGDILTPARIKPVAAASGFVEENVGVMKHFIQGHLGHRGTETDRLGAIAPGEGDVVAWDGRKLACYRDPEGTLHTMSAVCQHMGCIVQWNNAEKSWDCPCHGGRYDAYGKVLNGPPTHDLPAIDMPPS